MSTSNASPCVDRPYAKIGLFIAGRWRDGDQHLPVINPATGQSIGAVPLASDQDLADVLDAAAAGFKIWRDMGVDRRGAILLEAARLMRERAAGIGSMMSLEQGSR